MKLFVNQKEYHTDSNQLTVEELLNEIQSLKPGVAVAVNDKVVRKVNWNSTLLTEGDQITVITAVCGG
ncbi:MAG: sulfur carrier protein ThiS [Muribaculaceae bacterium]|nr:sulfur carrier protein ThiS [Muribaculaceae bacterium]MDE6552890.1 sulfur carrier protein ThiS [Muribaculaceae bacterium]